MVSGIGRTRRGRKKKEFWKTYEGGEVTQGVLKSERGVEK